MHVNFNARQEPTEAGQEPKEAGQARQGVAGQVVARQVVARQGVARQGEAGQAGAKRGAKRRLAFEATEMQEQKEQKKQKKVGEGEGKEEEEEQICLRCPESAGAGVRYCAGCCRLRGTESYKADRKVYEPGGLGGMEGGGPQYIRATGMSKIAQEMGALGARRVYVFGSGNGQEWNALSMVLRNTRITGFELYPDYVARAREAYRLVANAPGSVKDGSGALAECPEYKCADFLELLGDGDAALTPDACLEKDSPTILYSTAVVGSDLYDPLLRLAAQRPDRFVVAMFVQMWSRVSIDYEADEVARVPTSRGGSGQSAQVVLKTNIRLI